MKTHLRIGTRKSSLAMIQARSVQQLLGSALPDVTTELVPMTTTGDRYSDTPAELIEGKGIFLKELEEALLDGSIDCAVHSMKDVPTALPPQFSIGAVLKREDPRDALIARCSLAELAPGAVVGTGSSRRRCQLLLLRPDLQVRPVRGNVDTRVRKWQEGQYDALVLALAGLKRAGLEHLARVIPAEIMLPAAGQGALGVEVRSDDDSLLEQIALLDDQETRAAVIAERAFLEAAGGGCNLPIGVYGEVRGGVLHLAGRIVQEQSCSAVEGTESGAVAEAETIGRRLGERIIKRQQAIKK